MFRKNADDFDAEAAEDIISKIGADLQRRRAKRGERLEDIAEYLGIKSIYLYGIEQGDLSVIPHQRSTRSYLSSYANYLGMDGDAVTGKLMPVIQSLNGKKKPATLFGINIVDRHAAAVLASSVLLGVIAGWLYLGDTAKLDLIATPVTAGDVAVDESGDDDLGDNNVAIAEGAAASPDFHHAADPIGEAEQALAALEGKIADEQNRGTETSAATRSIPTPQVAAVEPGRASGKAADAEEVNAAPEKKEIPANVLATLVAKQNGAQIYEPENTDARVIVRALDTSWIQVSSEDRTYLWTRTMQPQEMLLVPNREDLELWAGDASGVEVLLDGAVLPALGPPGTVVRGLSLAPDSLKALSQTVSNEGVSKPTF